MVKCAVRSCKNNSTMQRKQKSNITFHRFPKDEILVKKWIEAMNQIDWEPNIWSKICSNHFPDSTMYYTEKGFRKLTCDAVPLLFLHQTTSEHQSHQTEPSTSESTVINKQMNQVNKPIVNHSVELTGTPNERKLKKEIIRLADLAKRRGKRCNSLQALCSRLRKKIKNLSQIIKELTSNQSKTS